MKKSSGAKLLAVVLLVAIAVFVSIKPLQNNINLGLDLQGGAQVVLQAIPDEGETVSNEDMQKLVSVLDKRVNELGVSEPVIQTEGTDRIIVELAGVDDPEQAIELIGKTAELQFVAPDGTVILTGADLKNAYAQINNTASEYERNTVVLEFTDEASEIFHQATIDYYGKVISIRLDDEEISAPTVNNIISGGTATISGGFATFQEAADLASLLRGGALPVKLDILSQNTVGPSLGADSLQKSLVASAIGFAILFLFMILYYRVPGFWACFSLVVYALLLLWILNLIHATLTLTSIAGFILSVGVAVDANIIIYERIREEVFVGKSLRASIESGFKRAFMTIFDSNLTTLLAAIVLYFFGSGTIKGFALTLAIGIVASMFTAITFTRCMLRWSAQVDFLAKPNLYLTGINHKEFKFDFVGKRKLWYGIAIIFIVPGLLVSAISGMNLGIDFTGGSIIEVQYDSPVELNMVRDTVSSAVGHTPSVNEGADNTFIIRTEELEEAESIALIDQLEELGSLNLLRNNRIGPVVGQELMANARWAMLIAGVLMLIYISIRFRFNYAITAVAALLHDVLVVFSIFAIFRIEIDSSFIAAILTIIGYSINNTIVIFDRIRENEAGRGKQTRWELINTSINQTLTRTIITTLVVLILLFALLLFGGETTKNFILALIIGMFAGFFSSVFLAGNLLGWLSSRLTAKWGGDRPNSAAVKKNMTKKKKAELAN